MTFSREDIALSQFKPVVYKIIFHFCLLKNLTSQEICTCGTVSLGTIPQWLILISFYHLDMALLCFE